jgi:hypothetical protein
VSREDLLFCKYDIGSLVGGHTESVKKRVQEFPANTLLNGSEHDLKSTLVE